jgi:hypothetical protein
MPVVQKGSMPTGTVLMLLGFELDVELLLGLQRAMFVFS